MLRAVTSRPVTSSPVTSSPVTSPAASVTSLASLAAAVARARGRRHPEVPPGWEEQFRDSFVPLSREQLQHVLLTEFHPSGSSRAAFLAFAARLDRALHPRYHRLHLHLQALYGPIDPDRDTGDPGGPGGSPGGSPGGRRERRVVAALAPLLAEANFQRLPEAAIAFALLVQHPLDEVQISVRLEEYEEIQFWAQRQSGVGPARPPAPAALASYGRPLSPPQPGAVPPRRRYFRRVVVVARPRGAGLELAAFREVPLEALELLLGRGRVRTPGLTRARLHLGLAAWGSLLFLNLGLGLMADLKVGATALLLGLGALVAFRGAKAFARRREAAALELARSRYRRATAQHGELVAALTRRAQDEATKEALLAHTFLPRCRGPAVPAAEAEARLQAEVEAWLRGRFGLPLAFPARRACQRLRGLGGDPGSPRTGGTPTPPEPGGTPGPRSLGGGWREAQAWDPQSRPGACGAWRGLEGPGGHPKI
ncbi:transmembrane protein 143 [Ciconia boyciana]|uniref:transmembrane protein 143 n=1 Tax=Ciconia boyciana TaxID=52775 RepID=UPI003BA2A990